MIAILAILAQLWAPQAPDSPFYDVLTGRAISQSGLFLQSGTGATLQTIETKLRQTVSVKDFGAVGDGVTDDSTAVTNAINASGINQAIDFACPGNYKTTLYGTLTCGDYYPPISGVTGSIPRSLPQKILDIVDVKDFGAKGDGIADDGAAIQAAINAVQTGTNVKGSILLFPSGTYYVCTGLPLTITGSIDVRGQGWNQSPTGPTVGTIIQGCGSAGAIDVFLVQPTGSSTITIRMGNFAVIPKAGNPARYVFHLDGTNGAIVDSIFERLFIALSSGNRSFYGEGAGLGQGIPDVTTIQDSVIGVGIQFTTAGDLVRLFRNRFPAWSGGNMIDVSFQPGASSFIVEQNNITANSGAAIHLGTSVVAPMIINNELETGASFTGSNGALVDMDATSGSHMTDAMIVGNSFQIVNGITTDSLRINYSDRAYVSGNRFGRGLTTSHDITVTANASDTTIPHNMWANGGPYASMINNAGTRTMAAIVYPATNIFVLPNAQLYGALDDANNPEYLMGIDGAGVGNFYGYHSRALASGANGITHLFDGTAASNVGLSISSVYSAAPVAGTFATVSHLGVTTGVGADQGGFKHKRGTAGCATAAAAGAVCTTTVTWTTAFADANYTATCGGRLVTSGVPVNGGLTAQIAASVTFQTVAGTAAAAQYTNIDCKAVHD